jgi:photosystem II stability/assembly factor-like uncharacterized protein
MRKKVYLMIIMTGFLINGTLDAQWIKEICPTKKNLNSISFSDKSTGWIVGNDGIILCKINNTWKLYPCSTDKDLYSVSMISESEGWAVGEDGEIIHFDGKNWENSISPTKHDLYSVSFADPENGIAVGANGIILNYDRGQWKLVKRKMKGNLFASVSSKNSSWVAGGLEGVNVPILQIQENGKGVINSFKPHATISGITMISPDNIWAVGSPSTIMHFNGQQWEKTGLKINYPSLNSVFFSDLNNGIAVGYEGTVLTFAGNSWMMEKTPAIETLNGSSIAGGYFYAVGNRGTIITRKIKTNNDQALISENVSGELEIFPNPCDGFLNIVIPDNNEYTDCSISINNSVGQKIYQKVLKAGYANLPFQIGTKRFTNGLYFINVTIGAKRITSRFIVEH